MEVLKRQADEENKMLQKRKFEIDSELSEVEPLVKAAKKAVGSIKSETLGEIRALRAPPAAIRDILEGVLKIMGILDTSWVSMKRYEVRTTFEIVFIVYRNLLNQIGRALNLLNNIVFHLFSFLAKRGVKEDIQTFDARKITPDIRKGVEDMMRKNGASFEEAVCSKMILLVFAIILNFVLVVVI